MATVAEIKQAYLDIKGSAADDTGLAYWQSTGDDIYKIRDDIARATKEDNKSWLADQYQTILGQDLGQAGIDYWLGEGGLSEDHSGHSNTYGSRSTVQENLKLHKAAQDAEANPTGQGDATVDVNQVSSDQQQMIDDALANINTVDTSNIIDSDSTSGIQSIATADVLADIKAAQGDIHSLQGKFAGLGDQTLGQVENIIDTKYGAQLKNLSSTYKSDVTDLKSQIGDLGTKTTKQYLDLESALGKASDQFGTRLDDMQTDWQDKFKKGQASLGDKITSQGSAFDKRLRDLSASMNYKMLDDSATGVQTRRSQAFKSGKTSKGTGQLGRSLRLKSLNI